MRILLASLFLCASATVATAQSAKCDVKVDSDKFVADLNGKTGQFVGNVIVTQCDMKMRADQVRITTTNGQADKVTATGRVVVDSPKSGIVTGHSGVYDVGRRMVSMTGDVVLKRGKDVVMRGPQLTVNIATGQATVGAAAATVAQGTQPQNTRVQAIFTPPSQGQ